MLENNDIKGIQIAIYSYIIDILQQKIFIRNLSSKAKALKFLAKTLFRWLL